MNLRSRVLALTMLTALALAARAQPALQVGAAMGRPGDTVLIPVDYLAGSGVVRIQTAIRFDASLFSSATARCPSVAQSFDAFCRVLDDGTAQFVVDSGSSTPLQSALIGTIELRIDLRAAAQITPLAITAQDFRDASDTPVPPAGSSDGAVTIDVPIAPSVIARSRGVRGDALIFPYYTARGDRSTVFVISNFSPFAKAIRINVREGRNGKSVIQSAFAGDLATGQNLYLGPGRAVRLRIVPDPDTGGARLFSGGCMVPPIPPEGLLLSHDAIPPDPAPAPIERTLEGFVTALVMADLSGGAESDLLADDCAAVANRFAPGEEWDMDPTSSTVAPRGAIAGIMSLRGLRGRVGFDQGPSVLEGFANANRHTAPATEFSLNDGNTQARVGLQALSYGSGAEAVSAIFMRSDLVLPIRARGTEWFFSFPTKAFFSDPMRAVGAAPVPPFSSVFGADGACETATLFPLTLMVERDLCWHTNIIGFDNRDLLESDVQAPSVEVMSDLAGRITFSGTGLTDLDSTVTLPGLPVLGTAIPFRDGFTPRSNRLDLANALLAKGDASGDMAGASVSANGRLVFVGVPGDAGGRGSVLVFRRHGTVFVPEATLQPPENLSAAEFGAALACDDNQVLIGAPGQPDGGSKGLSILQAAVYERSTSGEWNVKTSWESEADADDGFGTSVALDGDTVAIGAPGDDTVDDDAGAVYLYGTDGELSTVVLPSDAEQAGDFGTSVAVKNDLMAVGAPNATSSDSLSGSVSVYSQVSTNLTQESTLSGSSAADGDAFGTSVSLDGNTVAVGIPGANGEDGETDDQGAVELFQFDGDNFSAAAEIVPDDSGLGGAFGIDLEFLDGVLVSGAPGSLGAGGASGALYVYEVDGVTATLDARISSDDTSVEGYGASVGYDGELTIVGAPTSAAEAGAALVVVDAEVLFFDDFEIELR